MSDEAAVAPRQSPLRTAVAGRSTRRKKDRERRFPAYVRLVPLTWAWLLPALLVAPMLLAASAARRDALLFPEGVSLAFGAWATRRHDWLASTSRLFALPVACALIGVVLARMPWPSWIGVIVGLTVSLALLQLTGTRVAPAMSACVLPILFRVHDPVYVAAVVVLCGVVCVGGMRAQRGSGLPIPHAPPPGRWPWPRIIAFWIAGCGWIVAAGWVLALPVFAIAPPILVAGLEFAEATPRLHTAMRRTALLAVSAGAGGLAFEYISVPAVAGSLAVLFVLGLSALLNEPLAPALAVSLLPAVAGGGDPWTLLLTVAAAMTATHLVIYVSLHETRGVHSRCARWHASRQHRSSAGLAEPNTTSGRL